MPDRIQYDDEKAQYLNQLIKDGEKLLDDPDMIDRNALPIDESDRERAKLEGRHPRRHQFMDCPVALPIKQRHFGRWYGAAFALIATVAGGEHPFAVAFKEKVYGSVVGCVEEGLGMLAGFQEAWKTGNLWGSNP